MSKLPIVEADSLLHYTMLNTEIVSLIDAGVALAVRVEFHGDDGSVYINEHDSMYLLS